MTIGGIDYRYLAVDGFGGKRWQPTDVTFRKTVVGQLCVRSHRLSALEGPWPDHEPGLHPDEDGRSLRQSDDRPKPALADRLHLSEGHRMGLVLFVHRAR